MTLANNVAISTFRVIGTAEIQSLTAAAAESPRRRKNLNIHPLLDDPVQRLFNAMEPDTYVRPHRHARPEGWEFMVAIRGAFSVLAFDERGRVVARADIEAGTGVAAVEIPAYVWHAVVARAPGTVMFEVKPGPYHAVDDKDFACWAPPEGVAAASAFVAWYQRVQLGELPPHWS